jgi:organic radical activating enzyme
MAGLITGFSSPLRCNLNTQPIEKKEVSNSVYLDVHSIFYTIQGEGPFAGTPAVFIRLAGCNLQCPGCDTDYTSKRDSMHVADIITTVSKLSKTGLVVITGGEPFRQNLIKLLPFLTFEGYYVQIETNGTLPPPENTVFSVITDYRQGVYIVCSPKTGKINRLTLDNSCCLKYVIEHNDYDKEDGLPLHALRHSASPRLARPPIGFKRPIYLQPMDSQNHGVNLRNQAVAIEGCMRHGYILQLQIHKIINME